MRRLKNIISKIVGSGDIDISVSKSYLIVSRGREINMIKYLIADEIEYGVKDLDMASLQRYIELFSSIYSKLPEGCELKIIKLLKDKSKIIRSVENEMLNIKAMIDNAKEPHVVRRLERRLRILQHIYSKLISSGDIERIIMVLKIRGRGSDKQQIMNSIESLSDFLKSFFSINLGIRLRDATPKEIKSIIEYEIGLSLRCVGKPILIETRRLASLSPIPYSKKPYVEEYSGIYLGMDIETKWPVIIDREMLYRHVLIVGPTGRGKTTTLATIIENVTSIYDMRVIGFDYKGDLVSLCDKSIIGVVTPKDVPVNILLAPDYIDIVDWALIIADVLGKIMNIDARRITALTRVIISGRSSSYIKDPKNILMDPDLAFLANIIELVSREPRYKELYRHVMSGTVFNLNGYGISFQSIYSGIVLNIIAHLVSSGRVSDRLIIIDEAWRVSKLKALHILVKEGRSRRVGVIMATQNIEDIPPEIIDNVSIIIVFGSHSDDYISKVARVLGLRRDVVEGLKRLGVGEAVLLNSLDPHPVFVRIEPPSLIKRYRGQLNSGL